MNRGREGGRKGGVDEGGKEGEAVEERREAVEEGVFNPHTPHAMTVKLSTFHQQLPEASAYIALSHTYNWYIKGIFGPTNFLSVMVTPALIFIQTVFPAT